MPDYPPLSTQVIGQAESALGALLEPLLARTGITFQQWLVLTVTAASGASIERGQLAARISNARKVDGATVQAAIAELADDLAGTGRVIAYDRRGYSRSGGEVVRSASAHALDAAAVLEALNARPTVVVGTSAGATIALDLAVRRPDLVRAIVVHEAAWRALRHPSASGLGMLARMQWLAWRGRYPQAAETLLRWVYAYRDGGSAWDAFPEQWRRTARENGRSVVADLRATMGGYPRPQDLATITAPVVCTYGSRSRRYMRSITRSLAQAIPTARVREIDGAAHAVPFDAPDNFARVIAEAIHSSEVRSSA